MPVRGLTHSKRQNLFRRASRMGVSEERVVVSAAVSIGQMLLQVRWGTLSSLTNKFQVYIKSDVIIYDNAEA